jgi:hypothetical protein
LANYSYRISADKSLVHLGEKESYEPLSRASFFKAYNNQAKKNKDS